MPLLLLLAANLACRGGGAAARSARPSAAPAAAPRRVVLISIDGAGARTVAELLRRGVLSRGGFARCFREGQAAGGLIPVDPTLTATNHISLVTGFPPAATGIVGNEFYPGGALTAQPANGFEAPIGTETLWEAARRQGRQVGVLTWPGADARGERRRASWGLVYTATAELAPQTLLLSRADWRRATADGGPRAAASGVERQVARVRVGPEQGAAGRTLDLLATGRESLAGSGYDRVVVTTGGGETVPLAAGAWGRVAWDREPGHAASWIKLLALAPDLSEVRLYCGGVQRTAAYPDEFAAALASREIDWPGSPDSAALAAGWQGKPGIDLDTWTEQAERMAAFWGETLRYAAARPNWDLLLSYTPVIDLAGHRLLLLDPRQPGFSAARRDGCERARNRVWQAVDGELERFLAGLDLARTTVVVVSDHGMVPVHTAIDPDAVLAARGVLAPESGRGKGQGPLAATIANGGAAFVYVETGKGSVARGHLLADLARRYADWRVDGEAPIEMVLTRTEAARLGLDHPNSGDLVLFAREGFVFRYLGGGKASAPAPVYGAHGYLATHPDMQALYLAIGAGIMPGQGRTVRATEVASRVAGWLGMEPPRRSPSKALPPGGGPEP